jgi:hypothetical protein
VAGARGRVEPGEQPIPSVDWSIAEAVSRSVLGARDRAAKVAHDHILAGTADRKHHPADPVKRDPASGEDHSSRSEGAQRATEALRFDSRADQKRPKSGSPQDDLERLGI